MIELQFAIDLEHLADFQRLVVLAQPAAIHSVLVAECSVDGRLQSPRVRRRTRARGRTPPFRPDFAQAKVAGEVNRALSWQSIIKDLIVLRIVDPSQDRHRRRSRRQCNQIEIVRGRRGGESQRRRDRAACCRCLIFRAQDLVGAHASRRAARQGESRTRRACPRGIVLPAIANHKAARSNRQWSRGHRGRGRIGVAEGRRHHPWILTKAVNRKSDAGVFHRTVNRNCDCAVTACNVPGQPANNVLRIARR